MWGILHFITVLAKMRSENNLIRRGSFLGNCSSTLALLLLTFRLLTGNYKNITSLYQ